ncbi:MAG: cytochrome c biogenesis protein CcsA [Bacteroidales bacterium]|nr:cytochrome c biogenesis protein CcsA [Bacteroidales bacterium]
MDIQYIGEHLLPGILGKTFIWTSFFMLLVSGFFYVTSLRKKEQLKSKVRLGDTFFLLHFATLIAAVVTLYYLIFNHYFEYSYVWQYSATDLPTKFLLSCFWAGQEGSFLIWALLQGSLGFILLGRAKDWKPWVMPIFLFGQFFLMSMLLGLEFSSFKIGSSPFTLLREMPQNAGEEIFRQPNYISMITEGNGLNPLLENIWMIIHPPSLFLGYAVALIPFSYAVASIFRKEYHSWLKPAMPWTLAAILTLGIGIILGGRWAYESLTFGGFWAWDPVENASLVPWLFLVASLHLMIIAYKRMHSYATTYMFSFLGWVFVVYATYLTRSGVLGETSVHAFGDSGMALHMLVFNGIFLIIPFVFLLIHKKAFAAKDGDEVMSREFWMLIGSVVVALSAFQVTITTSIPVINKVLGTTIAPPLDNVNFYNTWQLPFALLVVLLIGISQFMYYGTTEIKPFLKKLGFNSLIALFVTAIVAFGDGIVRIDHILLLFFVVLAAVISIGFIIQYIKKTSNIGASMTHAGFAIFILGVLLAFSNTLIISKNTSGMDLGEAKDNEENLVLMKGVSQPMGDYMVTYSSKEDKGRESFYKVDFVNKNDIESGKIAFSVYPSVNHNSRMGNVFNPDTKHFFNKDIYTFISFAQEASGPADSTGFSQVAVEKMNLRDTIVHSRSFIILDSLIVDMKDDDVNNAKLTARFRILSMSAGIIEAEMKYLIENGVLKQEDAFIEPMGLKVRFEGVSPDSQEIMVGLYEKQEDFIVLKAVVFPYMNVLWLGTIIMFTGLTYSIMRRVKAKSKTESTAAVSREK